MGLLSSDVALAASLATGTSSSITGSAIGTVAYINQIIATAEDMKFYDLNITNEYIQSLPAQELQELSEQLHSLDLGEETIEIEKPKQI